MAQCVTLEATDPTSACESELIEIAAELRKTCAWTPDDDGIFQTGCGHSFYFDGNGGPTEHQQKFCGYCGGTLIEVHRQVQP